MNWLSSNLSLEAQDLLSTYAVPVFLLVVALLAWALTQPRKKAHTLSLPLPKPAVPESAHEQAKAS